MAGEKSIDDLLGVAERVTDGEWYGNLRDVGPGFELLRADAAMMVRASLVVSRLDDAMFIASAPAGGFSTAQVRFRRQSAAAGAHTIKVGSIVSTPNGRRFILQRDIAVGALDLVTAFYPVRAEFAGYEWDVLGQQTAQDGTVIAGEISVAELMLMEPVLADLTWQVEQVDAATGGSPPVLDEHGKDRGMPRFDGEQSEPYRERIRSLPLVITAPNILQAFTAILAPYGIAPTLVEAEQQEQFGALDWPAGAVGIDPPFVPDAGLQPGRVFGKWLDSSMHFGTFFVELPPLQPILDCGLLLDSPMAGGVVDLVSPQSGGRRAVAAYDLTNEMAADDVLLCALGGFDNPRLALLSGLEALLRKIKLGGIIAIITIRGQ